MSASKPSGGYTVASLMATLKRLRARRARAVALAPSAAADRQRRREELLGGLDTLISRYDRLLAEMKGSRARRGQRAGKGGARSG